MRPGPSICDKVRISCRQWTQTDRCRNLVKIHATGEAFEKLVRQLREAKDIEWDEEAWHYQPPNEWPRERLALYILSLDTINFCFWPTEGYEYDDLAKGLKVFAELDHERQAMDLSSLCPDYALSASRLASIDVERLQKHLDKLPPNLETRCRLLNEVGRVLEDRFEGSALKLISKANGSAVELVQLVFDSFPGFRDVHDDLYLLKRAQILVGDWDAALSLQLPDMDQLTTFADYRVPQLLRELGVLEYSTELATVVDNRQEIAAGSDMELAIRTCTVEAVEKLAQALREQDPEKGWTSVKVDWYLWQVGERMNNRRELQPHHRVMTTFY